VGCDPWLTRDVAALSGATGTRIGHGLEPQFPTNVALAALALRHGKLRRPSEESGLNVSYGPLTQEKSMPSTRNKKGRPVAAEEAIEQAGIGRTGDFPALFNLFGFGGQNVSLVIGREPA
jgi:hypothetical protein